MIDILFDISTGTNCESQKHLAEMLLPCSKTLWCARTRSEWEREYTLQSKSPNYNNQRRLNFGDLSQNDIEASPFENLLDRWLSQVDEFGTLIMAAAKLSEPY